MPFCEKVRWHCFHYRFGKNATCMSSKICTSSIQAELEVVNVKSTPRYPKSLCLLLRCIAITIAYVFPLLEAWNSLCSEPETHCRLELVVCGGGCQSETVRFPTSTVWCSPHNTGVVKNKMAQIEVTLHSTATCPESVSLIPSYAAILTFHDNHYYRAVPQFPRKLQGRSEATRRHPWRSMEQK